MASRIPAPGDGLDLASEIVVARPPNDGPFVAVVGHADLAPELEPGWYVRSLWGISVADDPALAISRIRLARASCYVLPGPPGETLYDYADRATAEQAARSLR